MGTRISHQEWQTRFEDAVCRLNDRWGLPRHLVLQMPFELFKIAPERKDHRTYHFRYHHCRLRPRCILPGELRVDLVAPRIYLGMGEAGKWWGQLPTANCFA